MKYTLFPLLFLLFLISCVQSPQSQIGNRIESVEQGLLSSYDDLPWERMNLLERMSHYNVPGVSIAVINNFQVEWAKGYGVLEAGSSEPVSPETFFQTGSLAKPVVALAVLHFVEEEILELDEDVNDHLVSWKVPENEFTSEEKVTLRRLLSHSAGMTVDGFRGYAQGEEIPDLQQILDGEPPANSPPIRVFTIPGTKHVYSGGGYMVIQQLLEDITGKPFPQIMRDIILGPWEMNASTFESTLPEDFGTNVARGHRVDGMVIPGGWHTYPEMGAGGSMWSTPSDSAKYVIKIMQAYNGQGDKVLSQDMAVEMLTPQIDDRGLGPVIGDDGGDLFYFLHPGANDGYASYLVAYPKRGQGAVIMTNGDGGKALALEIRNSISSTYGWVTDYTYVYIGITILLVLALLGLLLLWRRKARKHTKL